MKLIFLLGSVILSGITTACSSSICGDYCNYLTDCQNKLIYLTSEERTNADNICTQSCADAYGKLSESEAKEVQDCWACMMENIPSRSCDPDEYQDAFKDCDSNCNDDGMQEFLTRLYGTEGFNQSTGLPNFGSLPTSGGSTSGSSETICERAFKIPCECDSLGYSSSAANNACSSWKAYQTGNSAITSACTDSSVIHYAQCVLDNPKDYCQFISNNLSPSDNHYVRCTDGLSNTKLN